MRPGVPTRSDRSRPRGVSATGAVVRALCAASILATPPAWAAEKGFNATVSVLVTCGGCEAELRGHIGRALEKIPDVVVSSTESDFDIRVNVVEISESGRRTGWALAAVFFDRATARTSATVLEKLADSCRESIGQMIKEQAAGNPVGVRSFGLVSNVMLLVAPPEGLESACVQLVAAFDEHVLGPARRSHPGARAPARSVR